MKLTSIVLALAASAGALTAAPALAGVTTERVGYGDLELTTPQGQAELQRRLNRAAWRVCLYDGDRSLRASDQTATCYRQARREVAVEVAQIVADRQLGG